MNTIQIRLTPDQIQLAADLIKAARPALQSQQEHDEAFVLETRLRYRLARVRAHSRPAHPTRP